MNNILIYNIEVACCIAVFYLFFRFFLRPKANFQLNRIFIIFSCLLAFLLPALNIQYNIHTGEMPIPIEYFTLLPSQFIAYSPAPITSNALSIWKLLLGIWGIGFSIMLVRLLFSLYSVNSILKRSIKNKEGESFKITNSEVQSFSFFNTIVLNQRHFESAAAKYILAHEQAHSDQLHTVDVLLVECIKALQWFNPFAWYFTKESLQNLEYLADKKVVSALDSTRDYQIALVQFSNQPDHEMLRSEFSKSNLKNRIIMMNQPNNQKIHVGKLLLIIPLVCALFMSFSIKIENLDLSREISEILPIFEAPASTSGKLKDISSSEKILGKEDIRTSSKEPIDTIKSRKKEVFTIVEDQPYPSTGDMDSYYEKINADLEYPEAAKAQDVKGKVFVQFIVQKDGTLREVQAVKGLGHGCDEEAVRALENGPLWVAGKQRGIAVDVRMILPVKFGPHDKSNTRKISGTVVKENGDPVIGCNIIIEGTQTGTVTDMEGKFAIQVDAEHENLVYAFAGMHTKIVKISDENEYEVKLTLDKDYVAPTKSIGKDEVTVRGVWDKNMPDSGKKPMFIVDGEEIEAADFETINPNDIEHITVLKDKSAVTKYGENAKNGVLIIKTKESSTFKLNNIVDSENPPVIYKDGVEIPNKEIDKIDPRDIESIDVLKGVSATEVYGDKGKDGVILIKMKEK